MEELKRSRANELRLRTDSVIELESWNTSSWTDEIFDNLDVSDNTRTEYKYRIETFLRFVNKYGFHKNSYLGFKRYLKAKNDLSVSSKNKYLIVSRIYLKALYRNGIIPVNITEGIKTFSQSRKHKKDGLNDGEINAIVGYLHQLPPTPRNMRLKAILCLLIVQGVRQIEIVRLNVADIDLVSGRAYIQGKGRDDKEAIDLHPTTVSVLKEYLKVNRIADGALFTSSSNNSRNNRLTTKSIRNLINPILQELNIDKSIHGFRHFFVTKLVKEYKADLLEVCRYTRHRSIETLQVYNDSIKAKADLPRYYATFKSIEL